MLDCLKQTRISKDQKPFKNKKPYPNENYKKCFWLALILIKTSLYDLVI